MLRPESWVTDPLDSSLAWHLHDVLQFTPAYSLDEFPRLENLYPCSFFLRCFCCFVCLFVFPFLRTLAL